MIGRDMNGKDYTNSGNLVASSIALSSCPEGILEQTVRVGWSRPLDLF